jgi:hypothetical protein
MISGAFTSVDPVPSHAVAAPRPHEFRQRQRGLRSQQQIRRAERSVGLPQTQTAQQQV